MSYQIDRTDKTNYGSITVADQEINQETSLGFVGKNYTGYAKTFGENFLHLLENFAKATAPTNPVIGQLWYDTNSTANPSQPQLKVYDGTKWVAAGNVERKPNQPTTATIGDLWVDTANQQLYLWSGSTWILVGPQFSEGTQSGPVVESVFDTLNSLHVIIKFIVGGEIVAIISKDAFTPKVTIDGFEVVKQGINISKKDFDLDGNMLNKLWGTAESSDALSVSNEIVPAANFLRGDKASTTNYGINIRNNSGLTFGSDLNVSLSTESGDTVLYNSTAGKSLFVKLKTQSGDVEKVITVTNTNIGINKTNPTEALDVTGKIVVSDGLIVTSTTNATDLLTGSIKTVGGASVTKSLFVGQGIDVTGTVDSNNIIPKTTGAYDLGSFTKSFNRIYANTVGNIDNSTQFVGTFTGSFAGSVTGTASRLTSPTVFSITGDVASTNAISFTGQQPSGVATFITELSTDFISNKTTAADSLASDQILINRPSVGLRKITKTTFLAQVATVPTAAIFPFAGPETAVPNGYLLCDGAEVLISDYPELYAVINYTYKAVGNLVGVATFGLPDLRGRFPLGADNMNNGIEVPLLPTGATSGPTTVDVDDNSSLTANRVTDVTADTIGEGNGVEERAIATSNLPEHQHDMKGAAGTQFYAIRDNTSSEIIPDIDAVDHTTNGGSISGNAKFLPNSGGILGATSTDVPLNVMNPYLTINYIIFTGRIA
jgi:microcystin-dependent protein